MKFGGAPGAPGALQCLSRQDGRADEHARPSIDSIHNIGNNRVIREDEMKQHKIIGATIRPTRRTFGLAPDGWRNSSYSQCRTPYRKDTP